MMRIFSTKFSIKTLFVLIAAFSLTFAPAQFHDLTMSYTTAYASDSDGDGVDDADDEFPDDASEDSDHDHDGTGDNADDDDDGDGYSDDDEEAAGSDPDDETSVPADLDGDGIPDAIDPDIDGDGVLNSDELAAGSDPNNPASTPSDLDGDGVPNAQDMNPTDPTIGADVTPPVISAPVAVTAEANGINTTVTLGTATGSDNFDPTVTITNDAPASFPVGVTTVTYTATDAAGNIGTATQTVTITDTTAPVVTAPAAVTGSSADGNPVAVAIGTATATDLFTVTITSDAPVSFPVGSTTVTWTATDANGNASTATQLVTVTASDTTPPVITAPANVSVEATGAATTVTIGTATATDAVDGTVPVTNNAPATYPVGVTTVTYTATDAAGNTSTAIQTVIVTDTTLPVIALTGAAAITVEAGSTYTDAGATASDLVDGDISASMTTTGTVDTATPGSYTLTYNISDAAGNAALAVTRTVTVVDTTAPVITAPAAVLASSGDNLPVVVTLGTATATDLVDGTVVVTSDAPATFPVGATTVTYSATDAAGNTGTATQLVTVNLVDITPPTLTIPVDITAEATGVNTTVTLGVGFASDGVDGPIIPTSDAPVSFPVGATTVTWTATDAAGNIGTSAQTVTITDTTVPVITAPADVTVDSTDGQPVTVVIGTATATDIFSVTITNNASTSFPVGATTVTWTATDANGNASAATQLVTVNLVDSVPPVITVPANISVSTSTSQATVDIGTASANDNIDGVVAVTNDAPATFPIGLTAVIYTASDSAGNTATATQNIYVSYVPVVGGGSGGGTTPPPAGGGATVGMEAVYFHHNDHLGTPQAMTDINGTKVWEMSQTPFGIATVNEDVDGDGITVTNNFRFPGQYYDQETGHNYNYHRTYDPAIGAYDQHDLIGLNGGFNPFAYVSGNPINYVDLKGLVKWKGSVKGISAVVAVGGSYAVFNLESECVDGKKARVEVRAVGPAIGIGISKLDISLSGGGIEFDDRKQSIDPDVFNGFYMAYDAGISAIGKAGINFVNLGSARNTKFLDLSGEANFGIGATVTVGSSTVWNVEWVSQ